MPSQVFLGGSVRQNLLTLQSTTATANTTQSRLASGLKVASAIDDAVAYFTSKGLSDRAADISVRKGEIDQALSTVATAVQAAESVDSILKQLKGVLVTAKTATAAEKAALQLQFNSLSSQINLLATDATYNGTNLVNSSTTTLTVQFSALTTSVVTITGKNLNYSVIFGLTSVTAEPNAASILVHTAVAGAASLVAVPFSDATNAAFDAGIATLNTAIDTTRAAAKSLGGNVAFLQTRLDFSAQYAVTLTQGADKLRLADLNEEGANLVALQTRQQLGFQALAFAGQAEQSILTLFR
jgi:flagellin-like hook-associated protein FlgL